MQLDAYDIALIAGGFTVVGTLVGTFITYKLASHLAAASARRDAGRRLREAFASELAAMDPAAKTLNHDVEDLLGKAWPKHHAAIYDLAVHLPERERLTLEKAWREYYEVGGSIRFWDYNSGEQPRAIFNQRVNAILKHAAI